MARIAVAYSGAVALAFAAPMFTYTTMAHLEPKLSAGDVVAFILLVYVVPTVLLLATRVLGGRFAGVIDVLVAAGTLVSLARQVQLVYFPTRGLSGLTGAEQIALFVAVPVIILGAVTVTRRFTTSFAFYLGVLTVFFPAQMLWSWATTPPNRHEDSRPARAAQTTARPDHSVFIFMFDEVSLVALLNGSDDIDDKLFPNFSAFSRDSVWFRQAVANYGMTAWSANSFLSGTFVKDPVSDVTATTPQNLLTELSGAGFDVSFYSRFLGCSDGALHCIDYYDVGSIETTRRITDSAASIYLPPLLLNRMAPWIPAHAKHVEGKMLAALGTGSLASPGQATMVHLLVSHSPYILTPAGESISTDDYGFWQYADMASAHDRYRQQLQYLDGQFGAFRRGLEASGRWQQSVIVVTSDHGTCWAPKCKGRLHVTEVEPSLPRIPMMIRAPSLPARIIDADYQHVDALPTVMDALGIAIRSDWKIDGRSAFRATDEHRKRWFFVAGGCADVGFPARRTPLQFNCVVPGSATLPITTGID